jgi:hypothetical protein
LHLNHVRSPFSNDRRIRALKTHRAGNEQIIDVRGTDLAKVVSPDGTFPALKAKERSLPSVLRQWRASYRILRQTQGPGADYLL